MTHIPVTEDAVTQAADRLRTAQSVGVPCPPVRDLIGREDVHAAYAVQQRITQAWVADGARVVGSKIGLTSEAVQAQLGVDQPDFGTLFDDMRYADGDVVPAGSVLQPRAEAEIAFVLKEDLAEGDLSLPQIRRAIDYAVAAIEICGSRVENWDISFADTVADNASGGAFVLGRDRRSLADFEPRDAVMRLVVDGEEVSTGTGAACLGDPLVAVQWLARQVREFGEPLRAGQVILSGALGPMRSVDAGSAVQATVAPIGTVRFTLGKEQ
ncbi:2-keto-4-pentenoate hydratase [Micromonospora okii]|uniref:2-keto-4-pentenoate hydratase n=1 Tax=Micromonospora okii TaxID=1182970 RepID=UPI001E5080B9|nr:fumarylacetoacetate hydrolase family protein [Micromonospora okii]